MVTLGLETSCDETAAALHDSGSRSFSEKIARQFATHAPYGGVVPELASRCHLETVSGLVHAVCAEASVPLDAVDVIAATNGPGLAGALIVGLCYGKALAFSLGKPFVAVNHIEAHMYAACAETEIQFPFLSLVVSGGHTMLADISGMRTYRIVGRTRDDAAGEAFDKGAKLLGLGFPGGVAIEQAGQGGRADAYQFPRGMAHDETLDFSFSGLKTALLYFTQKHPGAPLADVAASYQEAVVDILVAKTLRAAEALGRRTIVVGGGVSANARLRALLTSAAGQRGVRVVFPSFALCTDNARMIAYRGSVLFSERGADDFSIDITPTFHPSAS